MIPSHFMRIDAPPILPNGKLSRNDLPDPTVNATRAEYVAPRDDLERALCNAFAEVLGLQRVGVTEDFYEIGGDSLSSMQVLAIMRLDRLSALDIFSGRTAERVAAIYRSRVADEDSVSEAEKEMEARKHPQGVTPSQRNVIDIQLAFPRAPIWIYPFLFKFGPDADPGRVLDACRKVSVNHPIFSTVFGFDRDGELQQTYDPARRAEIEIEPMSEAELDALRRDGFETFGLVGEPMVRIRVIKADSGTYVLIVFHHLVMDGTSMHIIFTSLSKAWLGQPLDLDTYYSYLEDQSRLKTTLAYQKAFDYYHKNYDGIDWCGNIAPDRHEKGNVNAGVTFRPEGMTLEALSAVAEKCGITRNGFMTAVSLLALSKLSGKTDVISTFAFHDRTDARKMRAGGFLAKTIPVGVRLGELETLADLYREVGRRASEGIANSAYNWDVARQVQFVNDIMPVVYETSAITDMSWLTDMGATLDPINARHEAALMLTELQILETPTELTFNVFYMATAYSQGRIRAFTDAFCAVADRMIDIKNPETVTLRELLG